MTADVILLGGYAAKQCPVRTHNDFAPLIPTVEWEPTAEVQADLDAGRRFEADVFEELNRIHPSALIVDSRRGKAEAVAATLDAMESSTPLILGGWLPDDVAGCRVGRPDILVKVDGGYLPADVKNHRTVKPAKKMAKILSSLAEPTVWWEAAQLTATPHHYEDGLQLAHYTRMLQACGFHPGEDRLFGAILGTSLVASSNADPQRVFVWHDLTAKTRPTFSRSRGKAFRSVLERYDHEHDFRVKVANVARRITGSVEDPEPLVTAVGQQECLECPYQLWCASQIEPNDPSMAITRDRLDVREWKALRAMGLTTTEALADLDPEDVDFFEDYYPEVANRSREQVRERLHAAVRQARMIRDGVYFEPITDTPVRVPTSDVEIDFDIEWDSCGRIYQWGFRVRSRQDESTARYEPIVSFEPLTNESELELAERAAAFLEELRSKAAASGQAIAVYHWHHVEVSMTRKFPSFAAALEAVAFDLHGWFTSVFHVRGGASIKSIAQLFGFAWNVEDPGGREAQRKIEVARGSDSDALEAQGWCLRYNESDVAAQAAIRDGVRAMFPDA